MLHHESAPGASTERIWPVEITGYPIQDVADVLGIGLGKDLSFHIGLAVRAKFGP
jgi:hypothetical protein